MKKQILIIGITLLLASCAPTNNKKDQVVNVVKNNSIAINLETIHNGDKDILVIDYTVYSGKIESKSKRIIDTIPSLGMTKDTSYSQNEDGDDVTNTNTVPQNYKFYIKLK